MKTALPGQAGTYILCLHLKNQETIQIGKLGCFDFKQGFYYYVGSAFGPGGLYARCGHHIKISSNPKWHIDYLRQHCLLINIIYSTQPEQLEHRWAQRMHSTKGVTTPVTGFGSSDCQCISHLFFHDTDITDNLLINTKSDFSSLKQIEIG